METNTRDENPAPASSGEEDAGLAERLAKLALAVFLVLFFIFCLAPMLETNRHIRPMVRFIDERGIDAGALYYTEVEEFSEADVLMNNTMDYMPKDREAVAE